MESEVVIIGGGLAGLTCALTLHTKRIPFRLIEADQRMGGRVQSDTVDGFRLDRGFQVFLTAYPNAGRILDLPALELGNFRAGAVVMMGSRKHTIGDPFRDPSTLLPTITSSLGTFSDKVRTLRLKKALSLLTTDEVFNREYLPVSKYLLEHWRFSPKFVQSFFRPFIGGITLDPKLEASSRIFDFVMHMFSTGYAALPKNGMQAIPDQLAARLPSDRLLTGTRVSSVKRDAIVLENGERISAERIVVATDARVAAELLSEVSPQADDEKPLFKSTRTVYFSAKKSPTSGPWLYLNGSPSGPVNSVAVPSDVVEGYAPGGLALISVSVLENVTLPDNELIDSIRSQLSTWFGPVVKTWDHLKTITIPYALPDQRGALPFRPTGFRRINESTFVCGDHCSTGSIDGAMVSGEKTALAIIESLADQTN